MSKIVFITIIFIVIIVVSVAGTILLSKRRNPRERSARIAALVLFVAILVLLVSVFIQFYGQL